MSSVSEFLTKFALGWTRKKDRRVLFKGLDGSGKSTALFMLVLGEVVPTVPTIGFNVETVAHSGNRLTVWDMGGGPMIRPLFKHYYPNTDGIVFCVDSRNADSDRLVQHSDGELSEYCAKGELRSLIREPELSGVPVAVACTKQDLAGVLSVDCISARLSLCEELRGRKWKAFKCVAVDSRSEGWTQLLDWLCAAMDSPPVAEVSTVSGDESEADEKRDAAEDSEEKSDSSGGCVDEFLRRADIPIEEMVYRLEDCSLCGDGSVEGSFGHYLRLRVAFAYLVRFGRRKGLRRLFDSLERFERDSAAAKYPFSVTVTYFWAHMVWFALHSTQVLGTTLWAESQRSDDQQLADLFKRLLFLNPTLCEFALFKEYYSEPLFLGSELSRAEFAAADIKPLPTAVGDDIEALKRELKDFDSTEALAALRKADLSDAEFIEAFEAQALEQWSHECRLRVIWCYLSKLGKGKGTRKLAVDTIMEQMQVHCGAHFHLTETYFWLQLVDFYRMLHSADCFSDWLSHLKEVAFSVESLTGADSKSWLKKLVSKQSPAYDLCDSQLWRRFYSPSVLFPKDEATDGGPSKIFVLPDIQSLPSIKPMAASG